jgi:hypothetical protein
MVTALAGGIALAIIITYFAARSRVQSGVAVTFVNGKTGELIKRQVLRPSSLPDSFVVATIVKLDGVRWRVDAAEPVSKAEFERGRTLRLELSEVTSIDPATVLHGLPTICDELGEVTGKTLPDPAHYQLREDDWRQIELVSSTHAPAIREELADIRVIHEQHREGGAFRKLHVRKRVPTPLSDRSLTLGVLEAALAVERRYEALSFARHRGTVPGGFAWTSGALTVWGVTDDGGRVTRLCFTWSTSSPTEDPRLAALAQEHGLVLVDWPAMRTVPRVE